MGGSSWVLLDTTKTCLHAGKIIFCTWVYVCRQHETAYYYLEMENGLTSAVCCNAVTQKNNGQATPFKELMKTGSFSMHFISLQW